MPSQEDVPRVRSRPHDDGGDGGDGGRGCGDRCVRFLRRRGDDDGPVGREVVDAVVVVGDGRRSLRCDDDDDIAAAAADGGGRGGARIEIVHGPEYVEVLAATTPR